MSNQSLNNFNLRLLLTTETELRPIAAPAQTGIKIKCIGWNCNTPAARGIPIVL